MKDTKNIIQRITDFIVFSNLWISIAAYLLTLQTFIVFNHTYSAALFFANTNFVSTFTMYNLQRLYQAGKFHNNERLFWYDKNRRLLFTLILIFNSLYFSTFKVNNYQFKEGLLFYIPAVIISLLYFLPRFTLRKRPYFKIFIISFIWVYTSAVLPLTYDQIEFVKFQNFNRSSIIYLIGQFAFIAAICIPFDIKDVKPDRQNSVRTLPVDFGIKNARVIGLVLLLVYVVCAQNFVQFVTFSTVGVLGALILYSSSPKKQAYFYYYLIDGLIILQFILMLLLQLL